MPQSTQKRNVPRGDDFAITSVTHRNSPKHVKKKPLLLTSPEKENFSTSVVGKPPPLRFIQPTKPNLPRVPLGTLNSSCDHFLTPHHSPQNVIEKHQLITLPGKEGTNPTVIGKPPPLRFIQTSKPNLPKEPLGTISRNVSVNKGCASYVTPHLSPRKVNEECQNPTQTSPGKENARGLLENASPMVVCNPPPLRFTQAASKPKLPKEPLGSISPNLPVNKGCDSYLTPQLSTRKKNEECQHLNQSSSGKENASPTVVGDPPPLRFIQAASKPKLPKEPLGSISPNLPVNKGCDSYLTPQLSTRKKNEECQHLNQSSSGKENASPTVVGDPPPLRFIQAASKPKLPKEPLGSISPNLPVNKGCDSYLTPQLSTRKKNEECQHLNQSSSGKENASPTVVGDPPPLRFIQAASKPKLPKEPLGSISPNLPVNKGCDSYLTPQLSTRKKNEECQHLNQSSSGKENASPTVVGDPPPLRFIQAASKPNLPKEPLGIISPILSADESSNFTASIHDDSSNNLNETPVRSSLRPLRFILPASPHLPKAPMTTHTPDVPTDHVYAKTSHANCHTATPRNASAVESTPPALSLAEQLLQDLNETIFASNIEEARVDGLTGDAAREFAALKNKLAELEKIATRVCKQNFNLSQRCRQWSKKYRALQSLHNRTTERIRKILHPDQINALSRKNTQGMKWGNKTIQDALVLKMKCGSTGYNEVRKRFPYPHVRSVQRYVQHLTFESGILDEVIDLLEQVVPTWKEEERDCMLSLDEMSIEPSDMVDPSTKKPIGKVTLGSHSGFANKALVFILGGVSTRRKISVAYYLTKSKKEGSAEDTGKEYWGIILSILQKVEAIGIRVHCVTTDMGSDNRAMWKFLGVFANRDGCSFNIQHPCRPDDFLCFMPDVPHVLKSANTMVLRNRFIRLPAFIVQEENLPADIVDMSHVKDLLDYEAKLELKAAPRLTEEALDSSGHFDKMKVSRAKRVINRRTASGLQLLALDQQNDVYLTTAWFINLFNQWFVLMTNRSRRLALSKGNPKAYEEALNHIRKTARIFQHMSVGVPGHWKPVQTGVVLASQVILFLQDHFLNKRSFIFLLTGRFTQDFLENLFSCIRFRQSIPHALAFKQNLKVITLAQYCQASENSSYDQDDGELLDMLTFTKEKSAVRRKVESAASSNSVCIEVPKLSDENVRRAVSDWELLVLYDVAGAVLCSVREVNTTCDCCFNQLLWQDKDPHPYATLTRLNQFKPGATLEVSDECFMVLCKAEITFRLLRDTLREKKVANIYDFLVERLKYLWESSSVPNCHDIWTKYLKRFFTMRYRMFGQKRRAELDKEAKSCHRGSKSMAMHKNTK